jgi:hypothetical protein
MKTYATTIKLVADSLLSLLGGEEHPPLDIEHMLRYGNDSSKHCFDALSKESQQWLLDGIAQSIAVNGTEEFMAIPNEELSNISPEATISIALLYREEK